MPGWHLSHVHAKRGGVHRKGGTLDPPSHFAAGAGDTVEAAIVPPEKTASSLDHLFQNNRAWASEITRRDPEFFLRLSRQQAPEYLWIGCSDSRVPANEIVDLAPGELFVHRNVANVVVHGDLNCLSVIQFAVDVLDVKHIIVCGHYGCGGVRAALENFRHGMIDNWLAGVRSLVRRNQEELDQLDPDAAVDRLCELNVLSQSAHVARTTIIEDAWERGQEITIHSWIYRLSNGLITPLSPPISRSLDNSD